MKNKFFAVVAIAAVVLTASCTPGGMSEETKMAMTSFEADWKASSEMLKSWGESMNTKFDGMRKMESETDAMVKSAKIPAKNKAMVDSLSAVCMTLEGKRAEIKTTYEAAVTQFNADEQAYTEWKKTAEDLTDEEVMAGINTYKAKLDACKADMEGWNKAVAATESLCMEVCGDLHNAAMPNM